MTTFKLFHIPDASSKDLEDSLNEFTLKHPGAKYVDIKKLDEQTMVLVFEGLTE